MLIGLFPKAHEGSFAAALLFVAVSFFPTSIMAEELIGATDFVTPDAPGTHVMTFVVGLAPGEEIKMHSHGGTGIILVLEGEAVLTELDGTAKTLKAGDTFMENAGDVHGAVVSNAGPARVLWTIVLPDGMELETPYSG
jgi:quercetin dioxygenase-like cupin family protein